ncbi:DUF5629 family protein [Pseudomonas solani]|uniref:DUF5629 family protein n=1 Tax=Pseudomonas TaxID=286 RepID=UPI002928863F|nr:DUF5629 family protein [Pseudomonas sp. zfem005]MDU9415979.1 DUF5629 family protein [Pseudomonas sp. zfem005]
MSNETTLLDRLANSDMLEIDGLHAWQFELDAGALLIECVDGRTQRRWNFSAEQVQAAQFDAAQGTWTLHDDQGVHSLVCMEAFSGSNDDEDEGEEEAGDAANDDGIDRA